MVAQTLSPSVVVGDALAAALIERGTTMLFGVPGGGGNLDFIGAFVRRGGHFVLAHTESAAAIMAATYGEVTGTPGAAVVTRGPGAASAANGLAHALLDRTPMILVTDAVPPADVNRISHQRLDHRALFGPVAKASLAIEARTADVVAGRALDVALRPPWGPVHVDVAEGAATLPHVGDVAPVHAAPLEVAEAIVARAKRPVVLLGLGTRHAESTLADALADVTCPILTTYKAKGAIPESWPTFGGLLTGATVEAPLLADADVIVAVGVDPVELIPAPWPYTAQVVSVDEWPYAETYFPRALQLVGPTASFAPLLRLLTHAPTPTDEPRLRWETAVRSLEVPVSGSIAPHELVDTVRRLAPRNAVATVDAGAHMLVAMPRWTVERPRQALISSGLATMGFALPAAIASCLVTGAPTLCLTGDGGLGMVLAEIETVKRLELPLVIVVFNDSALSLIEIKQGEGQGGSDAVRYALTDFAAIAKAVGMASAIASSVRELEEVVGEALSTAQPYLIDARVDPSGYPAVLAATRSGRR